jgi:hypothetical protein
MRFKTMNYRQLETRLNRITDAGKLRRFIIVAGEYGYSALQTKAYERLEYLSRISKIRKRTKPKSNAAVKVPPGDYVATVTPAGTELKKATKSKPLPTIL